MANIPGRGYSLELYGCRDDIYCQIVISSRRVIERPTYHEWFGPIPGIF